jgi:hypothetical protein
MTLTTSIGRLIVEDFITNAHQTLTHLRLGLANFLETLSEHADYNVPMLKIQKQHVSPITYSSKNFFLRSSIEYTNPQLTVEEIQGIIAARLLEVCGNYMMDNDIFKIQSDDIDQLCELLEHPPASNIVSFLLNTDDVEPDRYSMNPLKESIVKSGQSAFPSAHVELDKLHIDHNFTRKYLGTLISQNEVDRIQYHLPRCDTYLDLVDVVKSEQLEEMASLFGIDLSLPFMRMPLTTLQGESSQGFLHSLIREVHQSYDSIRIVYSSMGRSLKKRTTLLTVPHSLKGYGSKRAAKGRIIFDGTSLKRVTVRYRNTSLYPNAIDPDDVSIVKANDKVSIDGQKLKNYSYSETPSSPQFILYSLGSPEQAVIWHGVGAFGASQLVMSYTTLRHVLPSRAGSSVPQQFNLLPRYMWVHPIHDNIDTSVGSVEDFKALAKMGMRIEHLPIEKYLRHEVLTATSSNVMKQNDKSPALDIATIQKQS